MAQQRIFDLDALVASTPERIVRWKGVDHVIAGVTGDTYLNFLALSREVNEAGDTVTEAQAMEANFKLIGLLVPTIPLAEIRAQSLGTIKRMTEFVINEFTDMAAEETAAAGIAPAGEGETGEVGESG